MSVAVVEGVVAESVLTVLGLDEVEEGWREVVPELVQGLLEFLPVDRARAVPVEVPVHVLPVLDVLPQPRELVEPDRPAPVRVLRAMPRSALRERKNKGELGFGDARRST